MSEATRINMRISGEMNDTLNFWTNKLGVSKSQLCSIALQAGMKNLLSVVAAENHKLPEKEPIKKFKTHRKK